MNILGYLVILLNIYVGYNFYSIDSKSNDEETNIARLLIALYCMLNILAAIS